MSPAPLKEILLKLCRREDLTRGEARDAFLHLMSGDATDAQIGGLLVGLAAKGTTVEELVGAATVMREKVVGIDCGGAERSLSNEVVLDTCGTGGDVRGTFNISTAAAIIAASCGVKVVKHGNRSATSRSSSADVIEHLGVKVEASPAAMSRSLNEANICFAFARVHHPAMKYVATARTSLGIPTIFNLLGPLTNPGGAKHQLLGVFSPDLTDRLATVLRELGSRRAWVVHADDGLDEISTLGPTRVSELKDGQVRTFSLDPQSVGIGYARLSELQAASPEDSANLIRLMLQGKPGPVRDIAVLNAGAALYVGEKAGSLQEGVTAAENAVDSGKAEATLAAWVRSSQG
jgi:anthranilate phosphoribosyltransferase